MEKNLSMGEPLKIYPVSDLVNSPKTDDARCIEPVTIDRDFFERQWWGNEAKRKTDGFAA
jgi:hypothetical protein